MSRIARPVDTRGVRVDYERIASVYDRSAMREKRVDEHLRAKINELGRSDLDLLDVGCGTGNQLAADLAAFPKLRSVGVDGSAGMLQQAQSKRLPISWLQADASALPLSHGSIDYATMQFVLHHLLDPRAALIEIRRVLRRGGWLVVTTLDPSAQGGFMIYRYWPQAYEFDRARFLPIDELVVLALAAGFDRANYLEDSSSFDSLRRRPRGRA